MHTRVEGGLIMKTAENLRRIAQSTDDTNTKNKIEEHKKYVNKIIDNKLAPLASKGKSQYKIKVPKKMSKELLNEELVAEGFKTRYQSICGTRFIVVKW